MAKIWLQTSDGKLIHLPVVGADVNTPDTPQKISTSVIATMNRCLSGTVVVNSPYGNFTLNFAPVGRNGTCNQCGQCCSHTVAACTGTCMYVLDTKSGRHVCRYLTILPKGIGKTGGTECSIKADILNQMKGCTLFPEKAGDVADCPACSFTWS